MWASTSETSAARTPAAASHTGRREDRPVASTRRSAASVSRSSLRHRRRIRPGDAVHPPGRLVRSRAAAEPLHAHAVADHDAGQRSHPLQHDVLDEGTRGRQQRELPPPGRAPAELTEPGEVPAVERDRTRRLHLAPEPGEQLLDRQQAAMEVDVEQPSLRHTGPRGRFGGQHVTLDERDRAPGSCCGRGGEGAGKSRAEHHDPARSPSSHGSPSHVAVPAQSSAWHGRRRHPRPFSPRDGAPDARDLDLRIGSGA